MSDTTITSANSIFVLVVPGLFSGVKLQGYAADKAFAAEAIDLAEVQMGVDGRMTGGYVPNPTPQSITLQADSPSRDIFSALIAATKQAREVYWISGTITLPATGETFSLSRGLLTKGQQIPSAEKVLQPVEYEITWESIVRSLI